MIEYDGRCPKCGTEYEDGDQEILSTGKSDGEILIRFECYGCGEDEDYYFIPAPVTQSETGD